jgi:hypothetical protein
MRMLALGCVLLAAMAVASTAEAGRRHHGGCGGCCYVQTFAPACGYNGCEAPAAASPAAVAPAAAPAVAQSQANGYRSFSYQPATAAPAAAAPVYNSGYSRGYRSNQPMWMNGANKSLGRYNP